MIEVYCQNSTNGKIFEITSLVGSLKIDAFLRGQPGKCTFDLQKDPNDRLEVTTGSIIAVKKDGVGMFWGYVETISTSEKEIYKITALDQLWYLKNPETYTTPNTTADEIFNLICSQAQLKYKILFKPTFIVPQKIHDNKKRYEIIEYGLQQTLINASQFCFIRDDYGTIIFDELQQQKTGLIIGANSLLTTYTYELSIGKETANEVKVYRDNEQTGQRDTWIAKDSANQKRWGLLRHTQTAPSGFNEAQITELANNLLRLKNRETRTMSLNALGDARTKAGTGFILDIPHIGIREYMWCESVSHSFAQDSHTMSLGVFLA